MLTKRVLYQWDGCSSRVIVDVVNGKPAALVETTETLFQDPTALRTLARALLDAAQIVDRIKAGEEP